MSDRRTVLDDLRARRGKLTPRLLVEDSKPETAPLHGAFEWDDTVAGERFRLIQAAQVIRSVHVTVIDEPDRPPVKVRAYLPVSRDEDDPDSSYEPVETIARSARLTALVREQMRREWTQLRRKYQSHEEFWALVQAEIEGAA